MSATVSSGDIEHLVDGVVVPAENRCATADDRGAVTRDLGSHIARLIRKISDWQGLVACGHLVLGNLLYAVLTVVRRQQSIQVSVGPKCPDEHGVHRIIRRGS